MIRTLLIHGRNKTMFQLCRKITLSSYFSTQKGSFPEKDQPSSSQDLKQSAKKSRQKIKRLKQQQRQEQYQQKLQEINITKGSFNPFVNVFLQQQTAYLWLHRKGIFLVSFSLFLTYLLIDQDSLFCYKTMGVFQDPFTKKKKFLIINPYRENLLQNTIISIIEKQVTFLNKQSLDKKNSLVNKVLQKKLQTVLSKLEQKYKINFKSRRNNQKNYEIAESGQNICLWVVGDQKLIISTKLLKLSPQNLQNLILLMHSLHSRYLHVQNVSFWERMNLQSSTQTTKIIKTQKTFVSNVYSAQNIAQTIELIGSKYGNDPQNQNKLKQSLYNSLNELLKANETKNELLKKKQFPEYDLRSRLKFCM